MIRPKRERPGRGSLLASGMIHVVALSIFWWLTAIESDVPEFIVYQIELVSPPSSVEGDPVPDPVPEEELIVETPEPEPSEEPPPVVEEKPEEVVEEPDPTLPPPPEPPEEEKEPEPQRSPDPDPEAEETGEDLNVRMEGLERDYPAYYDNIIFAIRRCLRWREGGEWKATVRFDILRDGTVPDRSVEVAAPSRNIRFDLRVKEAVECASDRNWFGPLPEEFPLDRLPLIFDFLPPGATGGNDPSDQSIPIDSSSDFR